MNEQAVGAVFIAAGCLAAFLASPKSGAITGESIAAGGGPSRAVYY